jgi:tRNA (guanine37-N1)-methyltransferase
MRIAVVSLFPQMIARRWRTAWSAGGERGGFEVECVDPRDYATDPHRTVDDRPYGGGPGMVLKVEPLRSAMRAARARSPAGSRRVYLGADGRRFDQAGARGARLAGVGPGGGPLRGRR